MSKKTLVQFYVSQEVVDNFDKLAESLGTTRAGLLRVLMVDKSEQKNKLERQLDKALETFNKLLGVAQTIDELCQRLEHKLILLHPEYEKYSE